MGHCMAWILRLRDASCMDKKRFKEMHRGVRRGIESGYLRLSFAKTSHSMRPQDSTVPLEGKEECDGQGLEELGQHC